jgi:competence protein CoiA
MKYALANGQRQEAWPGLSGQCPVCGRLMVAKCGAIKIWHWAHIGRLVCDAWWEETEWHRAWKNKFPDDWQEFIHHAPSGEKHIADVRTDQGCVIEFQHSHLHPGERQARDAFYPRLVWVVNGLRRKTDGAQFVKALNEGAPVGANQLVRRVRTDACRLLGEWAGSHAPTFFDFGGEQVLWWVLAKRPDGHAYVAPFSRTEFIKIHRGGATQQARDFDALVNDLSNLVADYESHLWPSR